MGVNKYKHEAATRLRLDEKEGHEYRAHLKEPVSHNPSGKKRVTHQVQATGANLLRIMQTAARRRPE